VSITLEFCTDLDSKVQRCLPGSEHNDMFILNINFRHRASIFCRVAFKSPPTIGQAQKTVTYMMEKMMDSWRNKGRHDPRVVPRAVPIVEAMASLCIMDALLMQGARKIATSALPPLNVSLSS
jgi:chorismate synthase